MASAFEHITKEFNLDNKKILDVGCGQSQFLKFFGKGSLGITTDPAEVEKGKREGVNVQIVNAEEIHTSTLDRDFEVVWANNLYEHLLSPHGFLMKLRTVMSKDAYLILGVPVVPFFPFLVKFKKFRGTLASNHINFFTKQTFELTVQRAGFTVISSRPYVFNNRFIDTLVAFLSPHMYIVATYDPKFQYSSKKLAEWGSVPYYEEFLTITKQKHS